MWQDLDRNRGNKGCDRWCEAVGWRSDIMAKKRNDVEIRKVEEIEDVDGNGYSY